MVMYSRDGHRIMASIIAKFCMTIRLKDTFYKGVSIIKNKAIED